MYTQPFKIVLYHSNLSNQTDHLLGLYLAILSNAYTVILLAGLAVLSFLNTITKKVPSTLNLVPDLFIFGQADSNIPCEAVP